MSEGPCTVEDLVPDRSLPRAVCKPSLSCSNAAGGDTVHGPRLVSSETAPDRMPAG